MENEENIISEIIDLKNNSKIQFETFNHLRKNSNKFEILIIRASENDKSVTGEMFVNGKFLCHTLELPWKNNASYISSIPSGKYGAHLRYDKNDKWRVQLDNVPGRTGIQIHVGNWPRQIEGCVLVGEQVFNKKNQILYSTEAYNKLKEEFYGSRTPNQTPDLKITVEVKYNVGRTVFNHNNKYKFIYVSQAKWQDSVPNSTPNTWIEYKRDLKHVYFKHPKYGIYVRIGLHGGFTETAFDINGPWDMNNYHYVREN